MGTREVYEEKLRSGAHLHRDPTINPGLGSARCPRCLSLLNPTTSSGQGDWAITPVLHDATAVTGSGAGAMLSAVHGFNTAAMAVSRGRKKWRLKPGPTRHKHQPLTVPSAPTPTSLLQFLSASAHCLSTCSFHLCRHAATGSTVQDRAVPAAGHRGQARQHRPRARPRRGRRGRRRQARRPAARNQLKRAHEARFFGDVSLLLQEIWSCPYAMGTMPSYAEDVDGGWSPSVSMLSEVAAARKITIVGGSIPEMASGRLFNTCFVVGPDGEIKAKHRKLHLFGIDIPGDITFRESDTFTAGQEPTVVDTDVGRIGIGICHDIRFPELAMLYRSRGAHLICYPSAFNMSTGQLLWDLMQKSRAVDNQLFVATCSPARDPSSQSEFVVWGHSSVIGPFGEVLAAAGHEEATVVGEIDLSLIEAVRESLPLETQGRGDLYRLIDVQRECSG